MANKAKTKTVDLKFEQAMATMVVMLQTQQPLIKRESSSEGVILSFGFAAKQNFTLTFKGDRMVAAALRLVEGREPTTAAMLHLQQVLGVDTVRMWEGLNSGDVLRVSVVCVAGCKLADGCTTWENMSAHNQILADICRKLLQAADGEGNVLYAAIGGMIADLKNSGMKAAA